MMIGTYAFRDLARLRELAVTRLAIADGERLYRPIRLALDDGGNSAGINPSTQEHAERHVGHQAHANNLLEARPAFRDPLVVGTIVERCRARRFPVLFDLQARLRLARHS